MAKAKQKMQQLLIQIKKHKVWLGLVLVCVAVIVVTGIFACYSKAKIYRIAGAQADELSQNIINHYKHKPDYWGLSTNEVIKQKLYPDTMKTEQGRLIGSLDNRVEIGADENGNTVMPTSKNFVIAYNDLNKQKCIGFGGHKFSEQFWLKVSKITVKNETTSQDFIWGDKKHGLPVDVNQLKDLCNKDNNSVVVHF